MEGGKDDLTTIERRYLAGWPSPLTAAFGNLDDVMEDLDLTVSIPSCRLPEAVVVAVRYFKGECSDFELLPPESRLPDDDYLRAWWDTMDFLGVERPPATAHALVQRGVMRGCLHGNEKERHLQVMAMTVGDRLVSHFTHLYAKDRCGYYRLLFDSKPGDYDPCCEKIHLGDFVCEPGMGYLKRYLEYWHGFDVSINVVEYENAYHGVLNRQTFRGGGRRPEQQVAQLTRSLTYGNKKIPSPGSPPSIRKVLYFQRDIANAFQIVDFQEDGVWRFTYLKGPNKPDSSDYNDMELRLYAWSSRIGMTMESSTNSGRALPMWGIEKIILATQDEESNDEYRRSIVVAEPLPETPSPIIHTGSIETTSHERAELAKTRESYPYMVVVVAPVKVFPALGFDTEREMRGMRGMVDDPTPTKKSLVEVVLKQAAAMV